MRAQPRTQGFLRLLDARIEIMQLYILLQLLLIDSEMSFRSTR